MNAFFPEIVMMMMIWFQPIILTLLDIAPMEAVLHGVVMELMDCAMPLLKREYGLRKSPEFFFQYMYCL